MMRGPPRVLNRDPIQFGYEGDTIRLACDAFAIPKPIAIQWSQLGYPVDLSKNHYSVVEDPRKDGMKSTLIIRNSIKTDFDQYNCTVINSHGSDSFIIELKKQSKIENDFLITIWRFHFYTHFQRASL